MIGYIFNYWILSHWMIGLMMGYSAIVCYSTQLDVPAAFLHRRREKSDVAVS